MESTPIERKSPDLFDLLDEIDHAMSDLDEDAKRGAGDGGNGGSVVEETSPVETIQETTGTLPPIGSTITTDTFSETSFMSHTVKKPKRGRKGRQVKEWGDGEGLSIEKDPMPAKRKKAEPNGGEESKEKVRRRRQIDPTTCERDYSKDEVEFMNALDEYKRTSGRMFPTCSEILEVIRSLGYVKMPIAEKENLDEPVTTSMTATPLPHGTPALKGERGESEEIVTFLWNNDIPQTDPFLCPVTDADPDDFGYREPLLIF